MNRSVLTVALLICPLLTPLSVAASPSPLPTSHTIARQPRTEPARVFSGMPGFPSVDDWVRFSHKLDGYLVSPFQDEYTNVTLTYNRRMNKEPYVHVMVRSIEDVQHTVTFAKAHNLMLSIRSSGHSYIGRSTHDGGVILNFSLMKGRKVNLQSDRSAAGEITVESGNSWMEVYQEVDALVTQDAVGNVQRRVIVGGSAHTVAMGGYTQGGGHSPIVRSCGLAVDNLLEATIVLADGRKVVVNEQGMTTTEVDGSVAHSNDTSLFWAIRGGGGGTWGVITHFTFKLHFAPPRFRNIAVSWALTYQGQDIGSGTLKFLIQQLAQMSPQWGGYFIVSGAQLTAYAKGVVTLYLNHFGSDTDASNHQIDAIFAHNPFQNQFGKKDERYSTFLDYEVTAKDPPDVYDYIYNTFVQPEIGHDQAKLDELVKFFMSMLNSPDSKSGQGCTGAFIGGKMRDVADGVTPIHPKFRSGFWSLTCGLQWEGFTGNDTFYIQYAMMMRDKLKPLGEGSYFNEPAEDMGDWKTQFWATSDNYNRLLAVKQKFDPDNYFWCHNCVGSDGFGSHGP